MPEQHIPHISSAVTVAESRGVAGAHDTPATEEDEDADTDEARER